MTHTEVEPLAECGATFGRLACVRIKGHDEPGHHTQAGEWFVTIEESVAAMNAAAYAELAKDGAPEGDPAVAAFERITGGAWTEDGQKLYSDDDAAMVREALADRMTWADARRLLVWAPIGGQYTAADRALSKRIGEIVNRGDGQ